MTMNILYLCTHNRCRSVLSEAITNHKSTGRIVAQSAGSQPAGEVHPLTLKYLVQSGVAVADLSSKSIDDVAEFKPDLVVTLCDSAASEACPIYFGDAIKVHWGLVDPSKESDEQAAEALFKDVMDEISLRVDQLLALAQKDKRTWKACLQELGATL